MVDYDKQKKRMRKAFKALPWINFDNTFNQFYGVWYAGKNVYLVHDNVTDAVYFVQTSSKEKALDKVFKRLLDEEKAWQSYAEDEGGDGV